MTPSRVPPRLGVLLSGGGRTLLNLCDSVQRGVLHAQIPIVVASRDGLGAERAREHGLQTRIEQDELTADQLDAIVMEHALDWIVLAGYLRLVPITDATRGRIVNIHPALLPRHGGPGMHGVHVHRAVLDAGESESGCTVHLCDDRYDTGPILAQSRCDVRPDDTPETLAARVFELECELYPKTLETLINGEWNAHKGERSEAR